MTITVNGDATDYSYYSNLSFARCCKIELSQQMVPHSTRSRQVTRVRTGKLTWTKQVPTKDDGPSRDKRMICILWKTSSNWLWSFGRGMKSNKLRGSKVPSKVGAWKKGWQNRPQRVRRMDFQLEVLDRKRLVTSCSLYIHIIFITEVFIQQMKMQNI